jgi:hypothetical protein
MRGGATEVNEIQNWATSKERLRTTVLDDGTDTTVRTSDLTETSSANSVLRRIRVPKTLEAILAEVS